MSNVKNMSSMFSGASAFDRDLSRWELDSAVELDQMFYNAKSFNQDLCNWQVSLSPDASVNEMFVGTACPDKSDPNLSKTPVQPLCADVCKVDDKPSRNTTAPAMTPMDQPSNAGNPARTVAPSWSGAPASSIAPSSSIVPSSSEKPSTSGMPDGSATMEPSGKFECFKDNKGLGAAVREYVKDPSENSTVALQYGWPIATWCVDKVTDMDSIFKGQTAFSKFLLEDRQYDETTEET